MRNREAATRGKRFKNPFLYGSCESWLELEGSKCRTVVERSCLCPTEMWFWVWALTGGSCPLLSTLSPPSATSYIWNCRSWLSHYSKELRDGYMLTLAWKSGSGKNRNRFGEVPASEHCAVEGLCASADWNRDGPAPISTRESSVKHHHRCLSLGSLGGRKTARQTLNFLQ